jgi:hypothetical protein
VKGNKGVLFVDLYVNWLAFGKDYQITDDKVAATLYAPPQKPAMTVKTFTNEQAAALFDKNAYHYNLATKAVVKGSPIVVVPPQQQQLLAPLVAPLIPPLAPSASNHQPVVPSTQPATSSPSAPAPVIVVDDPTKTATTSAHPAITEKK